MPSAYQHHRTRLRIEQTRLLAWGQKVGLLEESLEEPSRFLEYNRNLVIDVLLEIQTTFKACVKLGTKYDVLAPPKTTPPVDDLQKDRNPLLQKALAFLEKTPQLSARLQWAMVKQDSFKTLVDRLIGYNDSIESILDKAALDQLQSMQYQTYMVMLQLTTKVDALHDLSRAMYIGAQEPHDHAAERLSRSSTLVADQMENRTGIARLADFKAQQTSLDVVSQGHDALFLDQDDLHLDSESETRTKAIWKGRAVWIEWKEYVHDFDPKSTWNQTIRDRVRKLASLLGSKHKPTEFRAPMCLGYFDDIRSETARYGFVYEIPRHDSPNVEIVSLRDKLHAPTRPSLTKRIELALAISKSLMYLHSVNWLHKGLRSDNILFFNVMSQADRESVNLDYGSPTLSGFDYARPNLPEATSEPFTHNIEHDLYRHPRVLGHASSRSRKSDDIYSLGVMLVEIAYWQQIEDIMQLSLQGKGKSSRVRKIRERLLDSKESYNATVQDLAGDIYAEVVRKCLAGGPEFGVSEDADETDPMVGVELQRCFIENVVDKLASLRL
jgi:Prion-inhibition and propagation/Protein kinase domain